MKIERVMENVKRYGLNLACPLCREGFRFSNNALCCKNGHSFDVSAKGYINFAPQVKPGKYTKELFHARQQIFEKGYYHFVIEAINKAVAKNTHKKTPIVLLDAGCGEGYYAKELKKSLGEHLLLYAMDISKEAILAAKEREKSCYMIADLAKVPLQKNSVDVLLNILSPANYEEFSRVLKSDGLFLKVIPGENYLKEIREQLGILEHTSQNSISLFSRHFDLIETIREEKIFSVDEEDATLFLKMTPLGFHAGEVDIKLKTITIDMQILVGTHFSRAKIGKDEKNEKK